MNTILDVEVIRRDNIAEFEPEFTAPGNYSKPEAIEKYKAEAREEWYEKAGLQALTGQIVLAGTLTEHVQQYYGDEKTIIESVWETVKRGGRIIGFNIRGFDLAYLCQRSWCLGIPVPTTLREGRWWATSIIDLLEVWCCYDMSRMKGQNLDAVCRACGLGGKLADGKDFAKMWAKRPDEAMAYNAHELELQWQLAVRLGVIRDGEKF